VLCCVVCLLVVHCMHDTWQPRNGALSGV
jgi:hypothetical protein